MTTGDDSESGPRHQRLQRRQRKAEIRRQLKRIRDEAASQEAAGDFGHARGPTTNPSTEEEVNRRMSLEANEQQAASKREREWKLLQNEFVEINRAGRARSPFVAQRRNGARGQVRDQAVHDPAQRSPELDVSDSDALSPKDPRTPAPCAENGLQSAWSIPTAGVAVDATTGPENACGSDADDELDGSDESDELKSPDEEDEANASDNPGASLLRIRWISQGEVEEQGLWGEGMRLYQSEATDALYFLNNLGEKIWLTDKNGDCVLAQDQNLDQTTQRSLEEAVP